VTATTTPDFTRICAFDLGLRSQVAQRAPTPSGFALRFAEQAFWDLNFLYVERPATDVETLVAEADAALSGLGHRMLVIDEPPAPERLAAELSRRGWTVERHVAMAYGSGTRLPAATTTPRPVDVSEPPYGTRSAAPPPRDGLPHAAEVPPPQLIVPRRVGGREFGFDEATIAAVEVADAAVGGAAAERGFVSRAADGTIAAWARLYTDGVPGQIEDVQTLIAHRRRGHGEAVVRAAMAASRAAGHDLTFLWADAEDFPRRMYQRLGFVVVGRRWRIRRVAVA
jgi:GNAT superfamily N-acetyltransferase